MENTNNQKSVTFAYMRNYNYSNFQININSERKCKEKFINAATNFPTILLTTI